MRDVSQLFPISSDPASGEENITIFCSYRNTTDRMVIVRARGVSTYFLERVVFPFEVMAFHCPLNCEVEVVTRTPGGLEQSEWVAARELMAGDPPMAMERGWRPSRNIHKVNVRASDSSVSMNYH